MLTNEDINKLTSILASKKDIEELKLTSKKDIEELKSYMNQGFEKLDQKIDSVDKNLTSQITGINNRIDDYALNKVSYEKFDPLVKQVKVLEEKVGV